MDYLRGGCSGCGQRVDDDGAVIPAVYWSCFREGFDDARYVYTLQQAIAQRQDSLDPACQQAVRRARHVLHETWDAIRVQPKYLATGMWPSEEFDTIRWRLAARTQELLQYPAANQSTAPSVLIDASAAPPDKAKAVSPFEQAAKAGQLEVFDLGGDFHSWVNGTAEGKIAITEEARHGGKTGLRWTVTVDWGHDGCLQGSHWITAALERADASIGAETRQDLAVGSRIAIALPVLEPGEYLLRATIYNAQGRQCSQWVQAIILHAGPS
jgi:hypothetical protein